MASARKSKAKKSKAKKTVSKKSKLKKVAKKKAAKRANAKSRPAAKKVKKTISKKPAAPKKKKKQIVGEGDYTASKKFLKDQADFVKRNKANIPAMGKEAEKALDGPEGESLRAAEQEAMNHSTIE